MVTTMMPFTISKKAFVPTKSSRFLQGSPRAFFRKENAPEEECALEHKIKRQCTVRQQEYLRDRAERD